MIDEKAYEAAHDAALILVIFIFILPHFLTSCVHNSFETTKTKNFILSSLESQ